MTAKTEEKKKRIAIIPKRSLTMRFDYGYLTDEEFDEAIDAAAKQMGFDADSIITYTLGTEDETKEGTMHFCPACGTHNEYGFEPTMRMLLSPCPDGSNVMEKAGWYKSMVIDCLNCNTQVEIHKDEWVDESDKLNEQLMEEKKQKEIVSSHPHSYTVNPAPCCGYQDSYIVSKETKKFHCFACGKSGAHE